ncbi:MAG TPA: methyltransferase [Rhodopila sp.]|uniref:methyltransferase n=1 Tax=Rhodopila sp. TaxID=2480087 RepID=UPI002C430CAC|nr:methyltransferase [Rhodopila sp.]HVY16497.1 methyltransferase [Rhodopila sp.]
MSSAGASADLLCERAAALLDTGRVNAARPLLTAARALAGRTPACIQLSVRIAAADGDWVAAIAELDDAIGTEPENADLRKLRAEARHRTGDVEGAARDAAEAVVANPADPRAKALLGAALLDLGLVADAASCLREAVNGTPHDPLYREALAAATERLGDVSGALDVLNEGILAAPGAVTLRNAAVLLCMRRRDFLGALSHAEEARQAGVLDAATLGMKGHALASLGRHEEAGRAYLDALKLDPEDAHLKYLVASSSLSPNAGQTPEVFIRTLFDGHADHFENHLISLRYGIPGAMRTALRSHPKLMAEEPVGPVLDLGCGTGLTALALGDLAVGPFTGVDISPRMLDHARVKRLYKDLHEGEIVAVLNERRERWPLIVAADVVCYFGALDDLLAAVHRSLAPGGWFVFSAEELLPDHDGVTPGDGDYALGRQGRYAHSPHYVYEAAFAAGFRVLRFDRPVVRQEAGIDVPGLLLALERIEPS